MSKKRLDLLLLEKGIASTRTKAKDLIESGSILVDGRSVTKTGEKFSDTVSISALRPEVPYVSRGGAKLESALDALNISVKDKVALDVGVSTGGFMHCLLERGARSVWGVDVGRAQIAEQMKSDPRTLVKEQQDIRTLNEAEWLGCFDFFTVDVSFISLRLILPCLPKFLRPKATGLVLVKPQFELGPDLVGAGGIVRDDALRLRAVDEISDHADRWGFQVRSRYASAIIGGDGNQEFFLHLEWDQPQCE